MSIPKICPMLAVGNPVHMAKCREDGCAWWNTTACALVSIAAAHEKAPASAANAGEGMVEQSFPDTDSTSTITENGGFVK